jgi:hypothetical protein
MKAKAERLIVGMATCFDQPSLKDGDFWSAELFRDWLDVAQPLPLLYHHAPIFTPWGVTPKLGTAHRFAEVDYPVPGIMALCEIHEADGWGDSALRDIKSILSQRWLPAAWGFSIAVYPAEDGSMVVPFELSLTKRPSFEDARVLGTGDEALEFWSIATGQHQDIAI